MMDQPAAPRAPGPAVALVLLALAFALPGTAEAQSRKARAAFAAPAPFVENRPPVRAPSRNALLRLPTAVGAGRPGAGRAAAAKAPAGFAKPRLGRAKGAPGNAKSVAVAALAPAAAAAAGPADAAAPPAPAAAGPDGPPMTMDMFLDRMMIAESGGRLDAKNPRSTALGPFQFIESTFLGLAQRHFAAETAGKSPAEVLALRTDMGLARRAAEAYTRENAAILVSHGLPASYPSLRLAFLLGVNGAVKVLKAPPDMPLTGLLGPAVLVANPFMARLTAAGLVARSAREVNQPPTTRLGVEVPPGTAVPQRAMSAAMAVRCNLQLPSCKRWLALETARQRGTRKPSRASVATGAALSAALGKLGAGEKPKDTARTAR